MAVNTVKAVAEVAKVAKVGRMKRIGNYFKKAITDAGMDYKMAAEEVWTDITAGKTKAWNYLALLGAAGVCFKANPSKADFDCMLLENCHDLSLVAAPIRNPESDKHIDNLRSADRDGRLHYANCGLFSLVWLTEHSHWLDLYEAKCKHTQVPWYQWHTQVVDVGFLGKFMKMSGAMKEYDVNSEEWKEKRTN